MRPSPQTNKALAKRKLEDTAMKLTIFFNTLLCTSFITFLILSASAQEIEDEREFNYDEHSDKGPHHWGELHPEWCLCSKGKEQSPINLLNKKVEIEEDLGELETEYKPSHATLVNRGHDIELRWEGNAGFVKIKGIKYYLKQCHWHTTTEHTIDGKRFDLEIHLVHESKITHKIAVIGILYKIRPCYDPFLSMLEKPLIAIANKGGAEKATGVVDPYKIQNIDGKEYYRYMGSLTVPPCTEHVVWTIIKKIGTVSSKQVKLLRDAVNDGFEYNARPLQPINKREVELYKPDDKHH